MGAAAFSARHGDASVVDSSPHPVWSVLYARFGPHCGYTRATMRLLSTIGFCALALAACSGTPGVDGGTGGGRGGGTGGGGGGALTPFNIVDLDPAARDATYFAMTYDAAAERVGVAYFTPRNTQTQPGTPDFDLKYVEYNRGAVSTPETIRFVQRKVGVSVAFDKTSGEPIVALLGGAAGFIMGQSIYWFQSDAVLEQRSAGAWTEKVIVTTGDQVTCGNPVSDRGLLVGMWPSLLVDPNGKLYFAYRDGHDGQFGPQDAWGTDLELWEGTGAALAGKCLVAGGNNKQAWGGHNQLAMGASNQPAIVSDQMFLGWESAAQNVIFQKRNSDGTWTAAANLWTISNTQSGPSLAYDGTAGYGIAAVDRSTNQLGYISSTNGTSWTTVDPVFGAGSGGWYPSLAMDPVNHEPAIAFYVCSDKPGVAETSCQGTTDELRITQRNAVSGRWNETVVDTDGAWGPKLGFFSTANASRRFVVYRMPPSIDANTILPIANAGALKLAVER
jgi:hypothetical protein